MADGNMTVHEHMVIEQIIGKIRMRKLVDGTKAYTRLPCPKCNVEMVEVRFQEVDIDRCPRCGGIWFDAGEDDKLINLPDSEAIDTRVNFARRDGKPREMDCPKCHARMISVQHPLQPLVMAEMCGAKCGMFLDAGEFTDFKKAELSQLLNDAAG